jgi:hypothetical protein
MGAPLGFKTFATGDVLTAADTNGYLMQGIWVFADAAARSAAVTSPQEGNMSFLKNTNSTEYYSGSAWVAVAGASSSGLNFISRTTFTSTAEAFFDNVFTSTYNTYLVSIEKMSASTSSDDAIMKLRRGSTSSTSAIYGATMGASYNTNPATTGTTNAAQYLINDFCDNLVGQMYFNQVGTGTSVKPHMIGTVFNGSNANSSVVGFKCDDAQNWNGFSLKSSSSNVSGTVVIYGLAIS